MANSEYRRCKHCGESKPFDEAYFCFYRNAGGVQTPFQVCKACAARRAKDWRDANPEKLAANRGIASARTAAWRLANPERARINDRRKHFRTKYGITVDEYDSLVEKQGGRCLICLQQPRPDQNGKTVRLAVDHDHESQRIRGLLCKPCNSALGLFGEDPERLARAIQHLRGGVA